MFAMLLTRQEIAATVIDKLSALGLGPPPGSRVDQMARLFLGGGEISFDDPRIDIAKRAEKDMHEFSFILSQLASKVEFDPKLRWRLKRSLSDSSLLTSDDRTPGRDLQAELYVEAILTKAGLAPVFHDPPDFEVCFDGNRNWVEVKRVKSLRRFEERLCDAFRALGDKAEPGFAIIDLSFAVHGGNDVMTLPVADEVLGRMWYSHLRRFTRAWYQDFRRWRGGREIRGLIFLDHLIFAEPGGVWGLNSVNYGVSLDSHNARRAKEFSAFHRAFRRGCPTPAYSLT